MCDVLRRCGSLWVKFILDLLSGATLSESVPSCPSSMRLMHCISAHLFPDAVVQVQALCVKALQGQTGVYRVYTSTECAERDQRSVVLCNASSMTCAFSEATCGVRSVCLETYATQRVMHPG